MKIEAQTCLNNKCNIVAGPHSPLCCAAALTPCEPKSRQYVFGSQAKYTCVTHLCIFICRQDYMVSGSEIEGNVGKVF